MNDFRVRCRLAMGLVPLSALLTAAELAVLALLVAEGAMGGEVEDTWIRTTVPLLQDKYTVSLGRTSFVARAETEHGASCGIDCQGRLSQPNLADMEELLSYETRYENGTRTLTAVSLQSSADGLTDFTQNTSVVPRRRRELYGTDGRFTISDSHFFSIYPFCTAVKLSSGCSGVLLSPRHVLTAARCVHDGWDYVESARKLRVGFLKLRSRRSQGVRGRRRGGERSRGKKGGQRGEAQSRRRAQPGQPLFQWIRVKRMQIPKGWLKNVSNEVALDYDYALLELKQPQKQRFMDLGFVPSVKKLSASRVHFSGFDDDREGQLVYRFCSVSDESGDLLYQHCDAQSGSTGSGVYIRLKEPGKKWKRKVIGVFSGHRLMDGKGLQHDYNVAVRITPAKYAQICHWIHGESEGCRGT